MTRNDIFKPRKSIKQHPLFLFILFFIVFGLTDYLMDGEERSIKESLFYALFMGVWMTFVFKYLIDSRTPVYFKIKHFEAVQNEVEKVGAVFRKEKNKKKYYRLPWKSWPYRRIILEKTPFYACIHVQGKMIGYFHTWIHENEYGLDHQKK